MPDYFEYRVLRTCGEHDRPYRGHVLVPLCTLTHHLVEPKLPGIPPSSIGPGSYAVPGIHGFTDKPIGPQSEAAPLPGHAWPSDIGLLLAAAHGRPQRPLGAGPDAHPPNGGLFRPLAPAPGRAKNPQAV